jgi:hypothetical protein
LPVRDGAALTVASFITQMALYLYLFLLIIFFFLRILRLHGPMIGLNKNCVFFRIQLAKERMRRKVKAYGVSTKYQQR